MTIKAVGRPKSESSKTNAQRQAEFRLKQKQNKNVAVPLELLPLLALGDLTADEIDWIKKLIIDKRTPKHYSLTGVYQDIVRECNRKNVGGETLVNLETLYLYALSN